MNPIEKMKLAGRLKAAVAARNIEKNPLKKLPLLKEVEALRKQLGFKVKTKKTEENLDKNGKVAFPELSAEETALLAEKAIDVTKEMGQGARKKVVAAWVAANLQGRSIRASDGKMIQFNHNDSINHLAFDSRRNNLRALAIPFVADVFSRGKFTGTSKPNHDHKDKSMMAFHAYQKWVELKNGYKLLLEVQAVERDSGKFEYAAYTHKVLDKKVGNTSYTDDTEKDSTRVLERLPTTHNNPQTGQETSTDSVIFDGAQISQEAAVGEPFLILKILDPQGVDVTDSYDETMPSENSAATDAKALYALMESRPSE
ncbi:hypothetical protein LVJ83_08980 [Uruburuella testudinis]|uniref:Large polyvalent protein-associated domain-containing protein n=1 Tax=Uruburuella testudinis TaxID=1282863 RepID=A0ABY4DPX5_9NEIS|nr:hypothetical protein [Uruburuella testudinis]UOO81108.1 hypothetical protein LVJ83_08980 [Uruburuella testudinis]